MNLTQHNQELIKHLSRFVSENRQLRMDNILKDRTRFLSVVLEDIYQPHNASAVLRSCECFGIQDVHIVERENRYRINPDIALGSAQWLTLHRYQNISTCLDDLKKENYQIAAMTLDDDSILLEELLLTKKTALCFGTEETGLSQIAQDMADIKIKIPQFGFTQSFNISVSAAISLYAFTQQLRQSSLAWRMSEAEKEALKIKWLVNSIPGGEKIRTQLEQNLL